MVLKPGTPENIGLLNTVITEPSCISRPSPMLFEVLRVEPASRSRPAFEFTETPTTWWPEALIVPPNDTRCAPDTTVSPTARLLEAVIDVAESLRNALPLVAIWAPTALPLSVAVAFSNVIELPLTLMPNTRLFDAVNTPVTFAADPVSTSRPWTPLWLAVTPLNAALDEVCSEMPNTKLSCTFTSVREMCAPLMARMPL